MGRAGNDRESRDRFTVDSGLATHGSRLSCWVRLKLTVPQRQLQPTIGSSGAEQSAQMTGSHLRFSKNSLAVTDTSRYR
jgi:hypothetical protein